VNFEGQFMFLITIETQMQCLRPSVLLIDWLG